MKVIIINGYWQKQLFENIVNIEYEYQPQNGDSMWFHLINNKEEVVSISFDPYMDKIEISK